MTSIATLVNGGGGGGSRALFQESGFEIYGDGFTFAPFFYPSRVVVSKAQKLARDGTPCGGEDVENVGSENREIHIVGVIRQHEKFALERLLDQTDQLNMISLSWSGEIRVDDGDYEGPIGRDAHTGEYVWKYTLNLVSTGTDESGQSPVSGILQTAFDASAFDTSLLRRL